MESVPLCRKRACGRNVLLLLLLQHACFEILYCHWNGLAAVLLTLVLQLRLPSVGLFLFLLLWWHGRRGVRVLLLSNLSAAHLRLHPWPTANIAPTHAPTVTSAIPAAPSAIGATTAATTTTAAAAAAAAATISAAFG